MTSQCSHHNVVVGASRNSGGELRPALPTSTRAKEPQACLASRPLGAGGAAAVEDETVAED